MTITEQQAIEWAGTATAEITALPPGRLSADNCRRMLTVSTRVVHSLFPPDAAQQPVIPLPEVEHRMGVNWGNAVIARDERKRVTLSGYRLSQTGFANSKAADDENFLKSFGHRDNIDPAKMTFPFLWLMFERGISMRMHAYVHEAVQWMMKGGTARNNFIRLLWAGSRDWEFSSAYTRGVVFLYAKGYKTRVTTRHHQNLQHQHEEITQNLLADLGLNPEHQLQSLAHLPSLTGRQARRNGVSERELRARWA